LLRTPRLSEFPFLAKFRIILATEKKKGFANGGVFFFWKKTNGPMSPYLDRQ
jgi:hypothetical protein